MGLFDELKKLWGGNNQQDNTQNQQGAGQAPSLADAWGSFVKGLQNQVQEKVQTAQANGTLKSVGKQNVKTNTNMMQTPDQSRAKAEKQMAESQKRWKAMEEKYSVPWTKSDPFEVSDVNDLFHRAKKQLKGLAGGKKHLNANKDAYEMAQGYLNDILTADKLIGDKPNGQDIFGAANKSFEDRLARKSAEYKADGADPLTLKQLLTGSGYTSQADVKKTNEQNVIDAAAQYNPNQQARSYQTFGELMQRARSGETGLEDQIRQAVEATGDETLKHFYQAGMHQQAADWARSQGQAAGLSYDEANRLMEQNNPLYAIARDNPGQVAELQAAFRNLPALEQKAAEQGGFDKLNPVEQAALKYAWNAPGNEWLTDGSIGENLSQDQVVKLMTFGGTTARGLSEFDGMFSKYNATPEQQVYLDAWRKTPEGAAQWVEDAKGTGEEQAAEDNEFFVSHRDKYENFQKRPDYAQLSQMDEQYLSDPVYAAIAGRASTSLLGTLGQTVFAGTQQGIPYMTPEERGMYFALYKDQGQQAAQEYYNYLHYDLDKRATEVQLAGNEMNVNSRWDNALASDVMSVGFNQVGGLLGMADLAGQYLRRAFGLSSDPINFNGALQMPHKLAENTRETIDQNLKEWGDKISPLLGTGLTMLHDTVMSLADSRAGGMIAKGAGLGNNAAAHLAALIVDTNSGLDTMQDIHERGGSDDQMAVGGLFASLAEHYGEKVGLKSFLDDAAGGKRKFAENLLVILHEAGENALQEGVTELANILSDKTIMGDKSEWETAYNEYLRLTGDEELARKQVYKDMGLRVAQAAGSGALMGVFSGAGADVLNNMNANSVSRAVGGKISQGTRDALWTMAEAQETGEAAKLAKKWNKEKASDRQVGELFTALATGGKLDMEKSQIDQTMALEMVNRIANGGGGVDRAAGEAIVDMLKGERLTNEQVAVLAGNEQALKIVDEMFKGGEDVTEGDSSRSVPAQNDNEAPVKFEAMPGMEEAEEARKQAVPAPANVETAEEAPRKERPFNIRVKGQEGTRKVTQLDADGTDVRLVTDGGETVALEDADVDADTADVIRAAADMDDRDAAAEMVSVWEDTEPLRRSAPPPLLGEAGENATNEGEAETGAGPVEGEAGAPAAEGNEGPTGTAGKDFAMGFRRVYEAAKKGTVFDAIRSIYGDMLNDAQAKAAYQAGQRAYQQAEAQAEARNAEEAQNAGYGTVRNAGADAVGVLFGRVREGIKKGGERVKAMLRLLDEFGKQYGLQLRIYDSLDNDANGSYTKGTNIINLSLDAEEGAITKAASHEGFHFITQYSPDAAKKITDFVLDKLRNTAGYDLDARVKEVQKQYKDQAGQDLTPDDAKEEIVADSMLDVIGTEDNMKQLMKESRSTAQKILNWISDTYNKFKEILNRLARSSPEVEALKDDVDYIGRIRGMWQEGMRQAAEAWQQAQAGYNEQAQALEQNKAVQQYREEMKNDFTREDRESSLTAFLSQLFMDTQRSWIEQHMDEYEEGLRKYRQALLEYKRGNIALNVALERQGLAPLAGSDIRVASYAADQVATMEQAKERAKARAEENAETNTGGGESYSLRSQPKGTEEENKALQDKAVEIFGKTYNWQTTGYLLPDGTKLDFSGKRYGSNGRYREEDHREILEAYGEDSDLSGTEAMIDFMSRGNIRIMPESGGIQMQVPPTRQQLQALDGFISKQRGEVTIDIDDENGNTVYSKEYDRGTFSRTILADIPSLFEEAGKSRSETAQFHSRYSLPTKRQQTETEEFKRWFGNSKAVDDNGKPLVMYHGTDAYEEFYIFKGGKKGWLGPGIYTTADKGYADRYARQNGFDGRTYELYVKAENPLIVYDAEPAAEILRAAYGNDTVYRNRSKKQGNGPSLITKSDIQKLKNRGYDSIIWKYGTAPMEISVFESNQLKSATDNNGNFDINNPDIRYSLPTKRQEQGESAAESVRQDAELYAQIRTDRDSRAALELLMRMHQQTTEGGENALIKKGTFEKRLSEMAEGIIEETATKMGKRTIMKNLRTIYQAMEQDGYSVGEVLVFAKEFYQKVLEAAPGALVEMDEGTKEAVRILRENPFALTPDQKSEIKGTYGSLGDWMRKNFGKLKIRNSAKVTLADVWRESLNPLNPGLFAEDTAEADMPGIIDAFLETAHEKKFSGEFGANIGAMATDMALNGMLDFYDVPGALKKKSEIRAEYQSKYNKLEREMVTMRAKAREAVNNAKWMYEQRYNERIERDKLNKAEREKKQGIINEIKRNTRTINTMTMKGTDNRHVPEALRGAMEAFVYNMYSDRAVFSGEEAKNFALQYAKLSHDGQLHDIDMAAMYDPDIRAKLEWLAERVGEGKPLRALTLEQLQQVSDVVAHLRKLVDTQNEIEMNGRKATVSGLADRLMAEMKDRKEASANAAAKAIRALQYKEMTVPYYAKQVGGVLGDLIMDVVKAESDCAFTIKDATERMKKAVKDYHVNDWIHDKKHLVFTSDAGDQIELTKEMAMTLYAWWEREKRNTTQSAAHLRRGGFTYDRNDPEVKKMKGVNLTKSHALSASDMLQIAGWLTEEQKQFVADMVGYLSKDMAEKGNEASMRMFGWRKFGEQWYFPYPTDRNFRGKNSTDAKGQPDKQIKYMGASHALQEKAMNPLKLGNFTQIWADHVDEMARYSAFAEKLDNLQRVTNYVVAGSEKVDNETGVEDVIAPESVKKEIERALGQEGAHYLEQFIRDANGGVMSEERGFSDRFISLFKKGSVAANMSVILQQPSAFVRAMSLVNPRYFGKGLHEHGGFKATRERMYKNSGVANLKQWGGFDTSTGGSFQGTLLDSIDPADTKEKVMGAIDEWTGKGAEKADEITWVYMYSAIEAEIDDRTDYKRGTAEFDRAVAERFDEVMRFTQVYDSTFAKSEWMRSTSTMDKVATSFMAEPTLWINMLADAALDVKNKRNGAGRKALRALAVFVGGSFVNSLLQSIATAFRRKKEDGTTLAEKYLSELHANFEDAISIEGIASMIPLARDVVSLLQGYDVERADMAVIGNLVDAFRKMQQHMEKGEMPDADEWMNLAGMAGNMFGVPVRNIWRDLSGIYANTFGGASRPLSETSRRDLKYTVLDNASWLSFVDTWDSSNAAYYDRMQQALVKGDMDKYNELRGYLEETKGVKSTSIDTAMKERIYAAVDQELMGEKKAIELLGEQFGMKEDTAYYAIDKWREKKEHAGEDDWTYNKLGNVMEAVVAGKEIPTEEKKKLLEHGYTEMQFLQAIETEIGKLYMAGDVTRAQAEKMLRKYADMQDADEIYFDFDKWDYQKRQTKDDPTYSRYVDLDNAVRTGKSTDAAVQELLDHGFDMSTINSRMKKDIGDLYKAGTLTKAQAKEKLKKVVGIEDTYTLYWAFDQWDYEKTNATNRNAPSWTMWRYLREAIDSGNAGNVTRTIKEVYQASDTYNSSISNQITSYCKDTYLQLYNAGKKTEAANFKALILSAYEAAGYKRSTKMKAIDNWVKNQNKAKQEHKKE